MWNFSAHIPETYNVVGRWPGKPWGVANANKHDGHKTAIWDDVVRPDGDGKSKWEPHTESQRQISFKVQMDLNCGSSEVLQRNNWKQPQDRELIFRWLRRIFSFWSDVHSLFKTLDCYRWMQSSWGYMLCYTKCPCWVSWDIPDCRPLEGHRAGWWSTPGRN